MPGSLKIREYGGRLIDFATAKRLDRQNGLELLARTGDHRRGRKLMALTLAETEEGRLHLNGIEALSGLAVVLPLIEEQATRFAWSSRLR